MSAPPISSPLTKTWGIVGQPEISESSWRIRGSGRMSTVVIGAPTAWSAFSARDALPHMTISAVPLPVLVEEGEAVELGACDRDPEVVARARSVLDIELGSIRERLLEKCADRL